MLLWRNLLKVGKSDMRYRMVAIPLLVILMVQIMLVAALHFDAQEAQAHDD